MNWGTWIALGGLLVTVLANIVAIVIFLTRQSDNLKFLEKTFEASKANVIDSVNNYKESITKEFEKFKEEIKEKIKENQEHTKEHIKRLEEKQDKHNSLIERMVRVEDSAKSAHKRLDDLRKENNGNI